MTTASWTTMLTVDIATIVYNREKDKQSATGQWFAELLKKEPWYKDVVPDVHTRSLPLNSVHY